MSAASEAHGAIASGPALAARIEGFGSDHTYSAGRPRPITATRACYNPASDALVVGSAGIVATVLTLLGAFTRLWRLDSPATPIYDETHVGRFLNWYHEGAYFFDVHPPLAKLGMFWIARALGYTGRASCPYEETAPYAAECALAPQRLLPALCGAALVPLTFATACVMRLHPLAATLGAWVVLVDPLWIGLSRVHLNDMVQMLFIALTHYFAIRACASSTTPQEPTTTTRQLHSACKDAPIDLQTLVALTAAGVSLGCALQCKFAMALTTLGWLGLQNLWTLAQHLALRRRVRALLCQAAVRGILLLGIPAALHVAFFAIHLSHVPNTGNGDGYMSPAFQSSLIGSPRHAARLAANEPAPSFASRAVEHLGAQLQYNRNMAILFPRGSHPFDSAWYTWPLAARGIYFNLVSDWHVVAADIDKPHAFGVFLHPCPHVTLATTIATAAAALALAARLARSLCPWPRAEARAYALQALASSLAPGRSGSLVVAYLLHWLPYATQERQTFLIYYLPAYYFAILLAARLWHASACAYLRPAVATVATLALAVGVTLISAQLAPMAYGSAVLLDDWTAALRLASTECWGQRACWVDAKKN